MGDSAALPSPKDKTMKYFSKLLLTALCSLQLMACGSTFSWDKVDEVDTVKLESIDDFMGCWYVISSIPTSIEAGAEDSLECYELRANSKIATTFFGSMNEQ